MSHITASLTVLFEDPFWVGVYERESDGAYEAARIVFGAQPKDTEVYALILAKLDRLRFGPSLTVKEAEERHINPKRMQRAIHRQVQGEFCGTKAQQAMKLLQEQNQTERKANARERRQWEAQRNFDLRQDKKKEKHRGH